MKKTLSTNFQLAVSSARIGFLSSAIDVAIQNGQLRNVRSSSFFRPRNKVESFDHYNTPALGGRPADAALVLLGVRC